MSVRVCGLKITFVKIVTPFISRFLATSHWPDLNLKLSNNEEKYLKGLAPI